MTDFDQLLQAASGSAETARRFKAIAADVDTDPAARLSAQCNLLKLQLIFARSFMDVVIEDVRRLSDDLSNGLSFELNARWGDDQHHSGHSQEPVSNDR